MNGLGRPAGARLRAALGNVLLAALALFPPGYRREYGEERAWVLRLTLDEAGAGGALPLLRLCAREGRDLPLALLREHLKEWRQPMNGIPPAAPGESLAGRQWLWFLVPFVMLMAFALVQTNQSSLIIYPILGMLALTLGLALVGLAKNLPVWALPSLGLAIGVANLVFLSQVMYSIPGLARFKAIFWTDFMPSRVLYALIMSALSQLPVLLLLVVLALLATRLPALAGFRQRLGRDWSLLPFLLYTTRLLTPFIADPYRGLGPYQFVFLLILLGGAWLALRLPRPAARLGVLMMASLLSGLVLTLGIYTIYPDQYWVQQALSSFPRWWETLLPFLDTLALLAALGAMAFVGARLGRREELSADFAN